MKVSSHSRIVSSVVTISSVLIFSLHSEAKTLDLSNDNEWRLNMYLNPPITPLFHVYLFNFTNPEEFLQGAQPKVQEVGPFVYKETWVRDNINYRNDGEIDYVPKRVYKFLPRLSKGNRQTDQITTLNIPMLAALQQMKRGDEVARKAIGSLVEILNQKTYVTVSARDLIWGYSNKLLKLGRDVLPPSKRYPFENFGLFVGKNFTDQGTITVRTGLDGNGYLGEILLWNNRQDLGFWQPGTTCSRMSGTDGFTFKPDISKSDKLKVFNRNVCRGITYEYEEDAKDINGIDTYKFVPSVENFESPDVNPDNQCYCAPDCSKISGVFSLSKCHWDSPVVLSWPHFFQADQSLLDAVDGLAPNKEDHQSFFLVEPTKGFALGAKARGQVNLEMITHEDVPQARGLRNMVFPLMWFSDDVVGITDQDIVNRVKSML